MKYSFKNLRFHLLLFLSAGSLTVFAQEAPPVFDWQIALGGTSYDAASKIIRTVDGGYVVIGTTYSLNGDVTGNHGSGDAWVVKLEASGVKQWQKALGGSNVDGAAAVTELPDGKIIVVCNTSSVNGDITSNHGATDIWVVALDGSGNMVWQKTFGGSKDDYAATIITTGDNQLLIGGSSQSFDGDLGNNKGSDDFLLMKIDTLGALSWIKTFGGSASDLCNSIVEMTNGGFTAVGSSGSADGDITGNKGGNDYWVIRTDANGDLVWQKSYGGSLNESALSVITNATGNIVMAGYANSNDGDVTDNRGGSDFWMVMLDSLGSLTKQVALGGSNSDVAYSIVQCADGGYFISGGSFSSDIDIKNHFGAEDFFVLKTDSAGNPKWGQSFGGTSTDRNISALQTSDGGFILAGYTYSNNQQVVGNHGSADIWVAKLSCKTPVASFTFLDDTLCVNSIITLTNTSTNSAVYSWLSNGIAFGNGTDVNFQFNSTGDYTISLRASTCYDNNQATHIFTAVDYPAVPTATLAGALFQSTPAPSYQWFTNGQPIVGETSQDYTAAASGFYYVRVANAGRCFAFSDSTNFDITLIDNGVNGNSIVVYPNPAGDEFTVKGFSIGDKLEIYNDVGEKAYSVVLNNKQETVNSKHFPPGIYLLKLGKILKKVIINH